MRAKDLRGFGPVGTNGPKAAAPVGEFVLVPRVPTDDMILAYWNCGLDYDKTPVTHADIEPLACRPEVLAFWRDMLAAAPVGAVPQGRPWFIDDEGHETRGHAFEFEGDGHVVSVSVAQAEIDRLEAALASQAARMAERDAALANLVATWRTRTTINLHTATDADIARAVVYECCRDDLATLLHGAAK